MKRQISMLAILVFSFLAVNSLQAQGQGNLDVKGEVTQEVYISYGSKSADCPIAYHIHLKIHNLTGETIFYDEVKAMFMPVKGKALTQLAFEFDPERRGKSGLPERKDRKTIKLGRYIVEEMDFTTDGYTCDLLNDATGLPLRLAIIFHLKDRVVAGPYLAFLPDIKKLPSYDKKEKGVELKFINLIKTAPPKK